MRCWIFCLLLGVVLFSLIPSSQANDTTVTPDTCQANGYKECYKGIKWGATLDSSIVKEKCPEFVGDRVGDSPSKDQIQFYPFPSGAAEAIRSHVSCDKFLDSPLRDIINNNPNAVRIGDDHCQIISLNNKLVGFYYLKNHKKDEILYLLSKLKNKYGKQVSKKSCQTENDLGPLSTTNWLDAGGLNIHALYPEDGEGQFYVRYINIRVFNDEKAAFSKQLSNSKSDADDKRTENLGEGL